MKKIKHYILEKQIAKGQFGEGCAINKFEDFNFDSFSSYKYQYWRKNCNQSCEKNFTLNCKIKVTFCARSYLLEYLRLAVQVQIMEQLHHENIVRLVDYVESPGSCYVVMEYCSDGDLEKLLKKINHFSEMDGIFHLKEILNGFKQRPYMKKILCIEISKQEMYSSRMMYLKLVILGLLNRLIDLLSLFQELHCIWHLSYLKGKIILIKQIFEQLEQSFIRCCTEDFRLFLFFIFDNDFRFEGRSESHLLQLIKENNINFQKNGCKINEKTQQLLKRMLEFNPEKRIDWYDLFNHPALDEEEEVLIFILVHSFQQIKDEVSGSQMIMSLTMSIPKMRKIVDLKFQSTFYKTHEKFQQTKEVDFEKEVQIKYCFQNQQLLELSKIKEQQQRKSFYQTKEEDQAELEQAISEQKSKQQQDHEIRLVMKQYDHQRSILGFLGKLLSKLYKRYENEKNEFEMLYQFIIAKKYFHLNKELNNSLIKKKNLYNLKGFEIYLESKYFKYQLEQITQEFNNYSLFFEQFLTTVEEILANIEFTQKYQTIVQHIKKFLNTKYNKQFNKETYGMLLDYYLILQQQCFDKKNENYNKEDLQLCYNYLCSLNIEETFPFQFQKIGTKNLTTFDFNKYHEWFQTLSVKELEIQIDIQFELTFSCYEYN